MGPRGRPRWLQVVELRWKTEATTATVIFAITAKRSSTTPTTLAIIACRLTAEVARGRQVTATSLQAPPDEQRKGNPLDLAMNTSPPFCIPIRRAVLLHRGHTECTRRARGQLRNSGRKCHGCAEEHMQLSHQHYINLYIYISPGERTVAHSTQGERNEGEEGRTNRPAAPPCLARSSVSASAAGDEGGGGG